VDADGATSTTEFLAPPSRDEDEEEDVPPPPVRICWGSRAKAVDRSAGAAVGEGSVRCKTMMRFDKELRAEWSHFLLIHVNE
jgi:hypothetical protein